MSVRMLSNRLILNACTSGHVGVGQVGNTRNIDDIKLARVQTGNLNLQQSAIDGQVSVDRQGSRTIPRRKAAGLCNHDVSIHCTSAGERAIDTNRICAIQVATIANVNRVGRDCSGVVDDQDASLPVVPCFGVVQRDIDVAVDVELTASVNRGNTGAEPISDNNAST